MQLFTRILFLLLATACMPTQAQLFEWAPDYPVGSSNYLL